MSSTTDLSKWVRREGPQQGPFKGNLVRLERLCPHRHGDDLLSAFTIAASDEKFRFLFENAPKSREEFDRWIVAADSLTHIDHFAVVLKSSGRCVGRQAFMRTDQVHGVTEIGSIFWGPGFSRTAAATEALYLFARHVFDDLGYRRLEWKCDSMNVASRKSAEQFGFVFEGVFRQHMVVKGINRDTAWFAMTNADWPVNKSTFSCWLAPRNFDKDGKQRRKLEEFRYADTNIALAKFDVDEV